jgi:hypothetical protein
MGYKETRYDSMDFIQLKNGSVAESCEDSNKLQNSIKSREFHDQLDDYKIL